MPMLVNEKGDPLALWGLPMTKIRSGRIHPQCSNLYGHIPGNDGRLPC